MIGRRRYPPDWRGERWCSACRLWKPIELFWRHPQRSGKPGALRRDCRDCRDCRECMKAYGRDWYRNNRMGKPKGWRKTAGRT